MTPDRKKPGVAFWATVAAVAVLVAYPLSFGPACRYVNNCEHPDLYMHSHEELPEFYLPIGTLIKNGPPLVADGFQWYASVWIGDGIVTVVPCLDANFKRGFVRVYPCARTYVPISDLPSN